MFLGWALYVYWLSWLDLMKKLLANSVDICMYICFQIIIFGGKNKKTPCKKSILIFVNKKTPYERSILVFVNKKTPWKRRYFSFCLNKKTQCKRSTLVFVNKKTTCTISILFFCEQKINKRKHAQCHEAPWNTWPHRRQQKYVDSFHMWTRSDERCYLFLQQLCWDSVFNQSSCQQPGQTLHFHFD